MHADRSAIEAMLIADLVQTDAAPADTTVADLILRVVARLGSQFMFGVPGGAIEPLYNALARAERAERGDQVRSVLARSEQGAVFMAHGFARESGTLGVCCATSGPGATNLVTGAASAMAEQVPLLLLTGQPALKKHGANALQDSSDVGDVDVVRLLGAVTKYSTMVASPEQLLHKISTALTTALSVPQGPVHLSIPSDVMRATIPAVTEERLQRILATLQRPQRAAAGLEVSSLAALMARLAVAKSPVFVLGERTELAGAALPRFLAACGIPAAVTPSGVGALAWDHPSFVGVYGYAGHASAADALKAADLVVAVGMGMRELDTNDMQDEVFNSRLVCVDNQLCARAHMAAMHLVGDLAKIFDALEREAPAHRYAPPATPFEPPVAVRDALAPAGRLHPADFIGALPALLPSDARLVVDAGNSWAWVLHHARIGAQLAKVRIAMGMGAMTWSIGAAIGAKLAKPELPVAAVVGDGAWLMSSHELSTAVERRTGVVFFILADQALGMVMHGQRMGHAERIAHELPPVDFSMLARAVGARAYRASSVAELQAIDWREVFDNSGPAVVELMIDREAVPPMHGRVSSLAAATPGQ